MKSISTLSLALLVSGLGAAWIGCSGDDNASSSGTVGPNDGGRPDVVNPDPDSGGMGIDAAKPDSGPAVTVFTATLSGGEEAPTPVASAASGTATFTLSADKTKLSYDVKHTVAGGTAAHIHLGEAGEAGAVVFPLMPFSAAMTGTITVTPADVVNLQAGKLYVNVHNGTNPDGELRGQILAPGTALFVARLSGGQETPPVTTTATGTSAVILNATKDKIRFHVLTSLTATAAHIHRGLATFSGPVVYPLAPVGAVIDGEQAVTAGDVADLADGHFYINLHTAANADGELRGQLLKGGETLYATKLAGINEAPVPVVSTASGGGQFILSADRKSVRYELSLAGVTATAAHIHSGATGVAGPVLYPLTLGPPGAKGTQAVLAADVTALDAAGLYANVHSAANPNGEIRGQITKQ